MTQGLDKSDGEVVVSHEEHARHEHGQTLEDQLHEHDITNPDEEARPLSLTTILAIASMILTYVISLGGFLCFVPIIQIVNDELGPTQSYTWLVSCWTVASGTGIIAAGSLSDVLGRRYFAIGTAVLGVIGALICALAQDIPTAISGMTVLGLNQAGGTIMFASISELVPTRNRGYVLGIMNASAGVFVICGSLFGHKMATDIGPGWRSIFWMIFGVNIFATGACAATYYPARPLAAKNLDKVKLMADFDYIGLFGIMTGPTLLIIGIIWIPQYGAVSGQFLGAFITGAVIMIALGFYEAFFAKNPMLHPFLFKRIRTFTMIVVVAFVGGMLFYSLEAFWPTYLAAVHDSTDGTKIGIDGMPFGAGSQLGGVGSALLLPILGPRIGTRSMLVFGVFLQLLFIPLMCIPGVNSKGMALAFSFCAAVGIGISELLTILLIQLATPDEWLGFAMGAVGLCRSIGGSAGTAIYTTVLQSKLKTDIPTRVATAALLAGLPQTSLPELLGVITGIVTTTPITSIPGITPEIIENSLLALKEAYLASFKYVWLTSIAFGVIAIACAAATRDLSPHLTMKVAQHLKTDHIHKHVEEGSEHMENGRDSHVPISEKFES